MISTCFALESALHLSGDAASATPSLRSLPCSQPGPDSASALSYSWRPPSSRPPRRSSSRPHPDRAEAAIGPHQLAGRVQLPRRHARRPEQVAVRHRRRRLGQQRAAVLHEQHQQRRPRRPGQPGHHRPPGQPRQLPVPLRALRVHVGPAADGGHLHPDVRSVRGADQDPARSGHLARVLDARHRRRAGPTPARSTSWRTSAGSPTPSTAPCTGPATRAAAASPAAAPSAQPLADDFHTYRVDWEPNVDHLVPGRGAVPPGRPRSARRQPLGVRPPLLHDPQRGGRR